jgi:hypothetical protein
VTHGKRPTFPLGFWVVPRLIHELQMDSTFAPGMATLPGSSPAVAVLRKLVDLRRFGEESSLASKEAALRQAIIEYYRQRSAAASSYQVRLAPL